MRRAIVLLVLAAGCGRGGFILPELDPCEDDPDACRSEVTVQRGADILFVIDNSGSMGREQGVLAQNFAAFIDVLEREDVGASYRIGVTTTSPEALGQLRATSCRTRLEEFMFSWDADGDNVVDYHIDEMEAGCLQSCAHDSIELVPTTTDDDPNPLPRPWIEKTDGRTNLPDGISMIDAFECIGPQGLNGSGFEAPLESMLTVVQSTGSSTGFLRDHALLAIILVTDETDCSMSAEMQGYALDETVGGGLWSVPGNQSSAICWNAGVTCVGGPGVYDDCYADNKGLDGQPTTADEPVLYPISRYVDALHETGAAKEARGGNGQVLVALLGGVPLDYPQTGEIEFQDSDDPEFNLEYGIGPSCGRGTETIVNPPGIPPVRALEFAEEFAPQGQRNAFSICDDDYAVALEQIAEAIAELGGRACIPGCVVDGNAAASGFQPDCTIVERRDTPGGTEEADVPPCRIENDAWLFPSDAYDLCWRALTDLDELTATVLDDVSGQCAARGSNLELAIERRDGAPVPPGAAVSVSCGLSEPEGDACPEPTP